jgi:hypothetical protein
MSRLALAPVLLAFVAAACGSSTSAPTSPSSAKAPQASVSPASGNSGGTTEIEGRVQALPPATAPSTFTLDGRTIKTDASTQFRRGSTARSFADLKIGMKVEAKGQLSGDTLLATSVELEDEDEPPAPSPTPTPAPTPAPPVPQNEVEFSGMVSGLTGSAASFQFNVGSRLVKGDATTAFKGDSNAAASFADLKNGITVEVKGLQQTGFVQATRIQIEQDEDENENEAEVEGIVSGLTGACPSLKFIVASRAVTTSASTRFDDVACAALKNNDRVEVKGSVQNGTLAATRVEKKS